jgi:hypothetical protein
MLLGDPARTAPPPPDNWDPDALALFQRMTQSPDMQRQQAINTCIVALKAAGVWQLLDVLWVLAAHDEQAALLNWKAATATPIALNTVFQADRGFTGDGISARIHTRYNPFNNGVNYKRDDASLWVWNRTASLVSVADIGSVTDPIAGICVMDGNGDIAIAINDAVTNAIGSQPVGFAGATRAEAGSKRAWHNGVALGAAPFAAPSTGVPDAEQWICGANPSNFSTRQIAAAAWGASLAGMEMAFYQAMAAYMTSVGAMADEAAPR